MALTLVVLAAVASGAALAEDQPGGECAGPSLEGEREALGGLASRLAGTGDVRILAIGSSSTEGVGASSPENTYPKQLESTLRGLFAGEKITVQNAGVGGETADATVARLETALNSTSRPDLVIWQVGTNDAVRGGDEGRFRDLLQRGVSAARRAGVDLMLADQQFYLGIPDQARYERFVGVVGSVAASSKVALFSRYRMMKAWHASHPDYLNRMLSKDRFHMGDDGYRCWGRIMAHAIASALPSATLVREEKEFSPYRTHAWLRF